MAKGITLTGIANITRTRGFVVPPLGIAAVAVLLLVFGVPSLMARLAALPGDSVRFSVVSGHKVSDPEIDQWRRSRAASLKWAPLSASYNDLALAAFTLGGQAKRKEDAQNFFAESEVWQRKALTLSPADPFGWFRLSYLFLAADGGPSMRAAAAWSQSLSAAPYEPALMLARLQMGLDFMPFLSPEAKIHFPRLIRGASVFDADELARLAQTKKAEALVEDALEADEVALAAFKSRLEAMK